MTRKKGNTVFGPAEHPWLDPLWRRIVLVVFCVGWAVMEYVLGYHGWALFVGAVAVYAGWSYLYAYKGPDDPTRQTRPRMEDGEG